jgi:S-methyl-1-thioxylulose 5-phosphate methylthiotransferase
VTNGSKVMRNAGFGWEGVEREAYKPEGSNFSAVTRQVLLGEGEGEGDLNAITRYYEIAPGGYSSLERHQHPHTVVVLRGAGRVILEDTVSEIRPYDCVYVAPNCLHQFLALESEPLGFLCIVDRERDTGNPAGDEDVARLRANPEVAGVFRR